MQLSAQVTALSQALRQASRSRHHRLHLLLHRYQQWLRDPEAWLTSGDPPGYSYACPEGEGVGVKPTPLPHRVIAADGSQLSINHHELFPCMLINVGLVSLTYGTGQRPLLRSVPYLLAQQPAHQSAQQTDWTGDLDGETALAWQRSLQEIQLLAETALAQQDNIPQIALVDGSLLAWGLEGLAQEVQRRCLQPWLGWMAQLQQARIPILGYVSVPRSREVVGYLRRGEAEDPFWGLQDRHLWAEILQPGQASSLWISGSRLNSLYGEQRIYACYVHGGKEVARLEFPAWLAKDAEMLSQSLGMVLAQVEKGQGYPVSLAEAHHLAVVRSSDRRRFLALLERELIRSGLEQVQVSPKQARKRHTSV
ncbi:MAG: DNA double-strand break repair nuclease NurA [Thermostichales cyanobacterium HHBFW_bins_127]